mmetsp:Transcript_22318/g.32499  ORF Transcript_22318/g.32499 Transcript_22318/m.32499 type:complete len:250 (+) Transcript_22318:89-838(+)|eukprot:CAMPEP_0185019858 /NCGR_PEP_ID=MMETSP1103-20130426/2443_1 /TAXON_ID=36769 /ORGANISM="Paraphysomonas bandaiensis, Strain Caron Lab Isolate" /LENGTH=249 /DNA_ID=CAMNT_0027550391 /DNA_START=21 /DNA_END=770 /DNA_ORIENTATION=+
MQRMILCSLGRRNCRQASTLVSKLDTAVKDLPHREAVRYTDKNVKWSAHEFNAHVDGHAQALLDYGFSPGIPILNWMHDNKVKHVSLLSAAKLGLQVTEMDGAINTVAEVRKVLALSNCRMVVFDPDSEGVNRLELLRMAIPEFYHYDDEMGQWFHSKHYPNLKFFLHSGFDIEVGCLNFKRCFNYSQNKKQLEEIKDSLTDDMPLYRKVSRGADGNLEVSEMYSHKDVYKNKLWGFADKMANKEYFEL